MLDLPGYMHGILLCPEMVPSIPVPCMLYSLPLTMWYLFCDTRISSEALDLLNFTLPLPRAAEFSFFTFDAKCSDSSKYMETESLHFELRTNFFRETLTDTNTDTDTDTCDKSTDPTFTFPVNQT